VTIDGGVNRFVPSLSHCCLANWTIYSMSRLWRPSWPRPPKRTGP